MKRYRSPAVVLRAGNFGESDRMVTFFTRDHGKIRAVAKGARRSKKRGFGLLQPFVHIEVDIVEAKKGSIPRLDAISLIDPFPSIATDPLALGYAGYFVELVNGFTQELEPHANAFDLLVDSLNRVDAGGFGEGDLRAFELLAARAFGLRPNLHRCQACGKNVPDTKSAAFSTLLGGVVCRGCAPGRHDTAPMSAKTRAAIRAIYGPDGRDTALARPALAEMRRFVPGFLHAQLGRVPRSVGYLVSVIQDRKLRKKGSPPETNGSF